MQFCPKCHSQIDEQGEHCHMTECVRLELKRLRAFELEVLARYRKPTNRSGLLNSRSAPGYEIND